MADIIALRPGWLAFWGWTRRPSLDQAPPPTRITIQVRHLMSLWVDERQAGVTVAMTSVETFWTAVPPEAFWRVLGLVEETL
jgi:hypothetical protein